jgi:Uma2 family endonuclease
MNDAVTAKPMTSDELFALPPSKKVDRWLFRGELRESKVTKRNPNHAGAVIAIGSMLREWLKTQPQPRGKVYGGEAYFRIRKDPDTNVGIDVALATASQKATVKKKSSFVDGAPLLAAKVLSPYDKQKEIDEMIAEYLECGVRLLWVVDPMDETVLVYRLGAEPVLFNRTQELRGDPELPGFRCQVAEIFE